MDATTSAVRHPAGSTRAVERALDLLAEVCAGGSVSLTDAARQTGLAPSTALRLLRTLEASAFVGRGTDGTYRPGARLVQLGALAFGRQSLVALAEPSLRRIVAECGESTYLSIPGPGDTALYVGMVEGTFAVRHTSWVGRTVPLEGTALGMAMSGEVGPEGFATQRSAVEPDVTAIAAPIRRPGPRPGRSTVAAVISVVGPAYRIDDAQLRTIGSVVSREAHTLSGKIASPDQVNSAPGKVRAG